MTHLRSISAPSSVTLCTVRRVALALGLLASTCVTPAFAQGSTTEQNFQNPIVGTWVAGHPQGDGSILLVADHYDANGTWSLNSIRKGGTLDGDRSQVWGRYTVRPIGNHRYQITTTPGGWAPLQVCTQYAGCTTKPAWNQSTTVRTALDPNHLSGADGTAWERVAQIPPEVASQVPQTVYHAPPALPAGGGLSSGGVLPRGGDGTHHIPGQGGTCDNLQQQRICALNDGYLYTGRDGCQHCSK